MVGFYRGFLHGAERKRGVRKLSGMVLARVCHGRGLRPGGGAFGWNRTTWWWWMMRVVFYMDEAL